MRLIIGFHDQAVEIVYPVEVRREIALLLKSRRLANSRPNHRLSIEHEGNDRYAIALNGTGLATDLPRADVLAQLLEELVRALIIDLTSAVALHAGAVAWRGSAILLPGPSGSGKSSLVAWLVEHEFRYLTDEVVAVGKDGHSILPLGRPILLKSAPAGQIAALNSLHRASMFDLGSETAVCPNRRANGNAPVRSALMLFPRFIEKGDLEIAPLSAGEAGLKLMECNLNARNLPDFGLTALSALARKVPALEARYGSYAQLGGVLDVLAQIAVERSSAVAPLRQLFSAFRSRSAVAAAGAAAPGAPKPQPEIPAPTARRPAKKLTVGMATYDDYDGVYFTIQALRMYHSEILDATEFVVIDNRPDGPCGHPLKDLENCIPNYRYVPKFDRQGTSVRDSIFGEAGGDFVLCVDCHVLIVKGAVKRLLGYFDARPSTDDLLQGPLVFDDLSKVASHFKPEWQSGMYGCWDLDPAAEDQESEPFEIPMQGLGLFACRRAAWPGLNPEFRGFGGEEGYLHEKFRQRGGRVLCLPFLRWVHRFNRPLGVPYRNTWEDRIRNYFVGFTELGLETTALEGHFAELLGAREAAQIFEGLRRDSRS